MDFCKIILNLKYYSIKLILFGIIYINLLNNYNIALAEDSYVVNAISVDIKAKDLIEARKKAISLAYRLGYERLLTWMTTKSKKELMRLSKNIDIKTFAVSYSIENEKLTPFRYRADISVNFDKSAIDNLLNKLDIPFYSKRGPRTLVLPVLIWGDRTTLWDDPNPWLAAWFAIPLDSNFTPIITPFGGAEDLILISAYEALIANKEKLKRIANKYKADEVLILRANINETKENYFNLSITAYKGIEAKSLNIPDMISKNLETLDQFLFRAAEKIGDLNDDNWVVKNLSKSKEEEEYKIIINFLDFQEWIKIKNILNDLEEVTSCNINTISIISATVSCDVIDQDELFFSFAKEGLYLDKNLEIWTLMYAKKNLNERFINDTNSLETRIDDSDLEEEIQDFNAEEIIIVE